MHVHSSSPHASGSSITPVWKFLYSGLAIAGVTIFLGTRIYQWEPQIWLGVAGILLCEVGLWMLVRPFFTSQRQYYTLRAEVDAFLIHVRQLNAVAEAVKTDASAENREAFGHILALMRQSVDHMVDLAGKMDLESNAPQLGKHQAASV